MLGLVKVYRVTGDEAEMCSVDARRAVKEHPGEWSYQPWSKEQNQVAMVKLLREELEADA